MTEKLLTDAETSFAYTLYRVIERRRISQQLRVVYLIYKYLQLYETLPALTLFDDLVLGIGCISNGVPMR